MTNGETRWFVRGLTALGRVHVYKGLEDPTGDLISETVSGPTDTGVIVFRTSSDDSSIVSDIQNVGDVQ